MSGPADQAPLVLRGKALRNLDDLRVQHERLGVLGPRRTPLDDANRQPMSKGITRGGEGAQGVADVDRRLGGEGFRWGDMAVIYRTNATSRAIERAASATSARPP